MNDKYAKEIAKELKLIRKALEKSNKEQIVILDEREMELWKENYEANKK